jgi:hypothetical protein
MRLLTLVCLSLTPLLFTPFVGAVAAQPAELRFVLQSVGERIARALPRGRPTRLAVMPFADTAALFGTRARADISDELAALVRQSRGPDVDLVRRDDLDRAARELGLGQPLSTATALLVGVSVYADYVVIGAYTPARPGIPGEVTAETVDVQTRRRVSTASVELIALPLARPAAVPAAQVR